MTTTESTIYMQNLARRNEADRALSNARDAFEAVLYQRDDAGKLMREALDALKVCAIALRDCAHQLRTPDAWDHHSRGVLLAAVKAALHGSEELISLTVEDDDEGDR